ncbi:MAG: hypothetical protein J5707_02720 [Candidatus Methanomethylophilus sp.]|nr:hypothetical protein [Methanomethylophilus sp.]
MLEDPLEGDGAIPAAPFRCPHPRFRQQLFRLQLQPEEPEGLRNAFGDRSRLA